jgi:hypothetical protein
MLRYVSRLETIAYGVRNRRGSDIIIWIIMLIPKGIVRRILS